MVDEVEGLSLVDPDDLPQPQLLVRLTEDVGKLPKGLVYRLPTAVANALIMHRKATPIADMERFPDLDVSEAELEVAGLDWAVIQG
jgi:hypothetical protein